MNVAENEIYGEESGRFYFDGKNITELADRYGIPLYVFSERELRKNVAKVTAQFRAYHANISIHYAARYESTVANLQIIRNAGGNLEVSSGGESGKLQWKTESGSPADSKERRGYFDQACSKIRRSHSR